MGGPAHHVGFLSGLLNGARYETLLLHGEVGAGEASLSSTADRFGARRETVPGLRPELVPSDDLSALLWLIRRIRQYRPDIVHTHTAKAGMLGRLAALFARRPRPIVVHTYHGHVLEGYFGPLKNGFYRTLERVCGLFSDALIGVSQATVDDLVRLRIAPRRKFRVIPIGLDLDPFLRSGPEDGEEFRREAGAAGDELLLVWIGRLVPIKRVDVLLQALASARARGAPVRLAIVGDGELRDELRALAASLDLDDRVYWAGYRDDMVRVAAAADIAVLSSDNEGTPVSLIEAAAAGKPAAATRVGGVADVVTPATGILVPAGHSDALGEAIATLADGATARAEMGAAARGHVRARYSVERLVSDIDALYGELRRR